MMIEQAVLGSDGPDGLHLLARSPGFADSWLWEAERLCRGFGDRPAGAACPLALFVQPFGREQIAMVRVTDQCLPDAGQPGRLTFHLLIVPRSLYMDLGGDFFLLAETFPSPWDARGELPSLQWTSGPPPRRTLEQVRQAFDVPYSATLLGSVQALVEGGRVAFERTAPAPELVRSLWLLLPDSTRAELWPATFAFSNAHRFHVIVSPRADGEPYDGYLFEAQAGDYPEGRYELALHTALDAGDEAEMTAMFSRRSQRQTMRLAVALLVVFILVPLLVTWLTPAPRSAPHSKRSAIVKPVQPEVKK